MSGQYQYYITDHLGNTRVVVSDSGKTIQRTDYYPFGLQIPLTPSTSDSTRLANKYLYNSKELQPETGNLDYGARQYGAAEARWFSIDPLADKLPFSSPYVFSLNNPLRYIDPDGRMAEEANGGGCCGETGEAIGGFVEGVGDAVVRNVKAITVNLPETIQGLASLSSPVGQLQAAVGGAMLYDKTKSDWNTGDTRTRANIVGNIVGEIGIAVAGTKGLGNLGKAGTVADVAKVGKVAEISKISPNVRNVLNTISDFKKAGGEIKVNPLNAKYKQELNMTFKSTDGSKLDLRVETHKLPQSVGGNGVSPQRHLNADVTNSGGNTVKMKHINGGHKILE